MQLSRMQILLLAATIVLLMSPPRIMGGDSQPYWPSEQEAKLEQLDSKVLETKRQLFAAQQQRDTDAVEKLSKQYKEQQRQRLELLRASGQLPR